MVCSDQVLLADFTKKVVNGAYTQLSGIKVVTFERVSRNLWIAAALTVGGLLVVILVTRTERSSD